MKRQRVVAALAAGAVLGVVAPAAVAFQAATQPAAPASKPSSTPAAQPSSQPAVRPAPAAQPKPTVNTAVVPVPREDGGWKERHELINSRVKQGPVDVVFIGDSITQGWEGAGKDAWEKHFAKLHPANLGIGGDRTQHVLWRLDHGNLDGIKPKVAVIMIGTNNSNGADNTAGEIADGIAAIVASLKAKTPETRILLLAIFPRGEKPNPQRDKLNEVNAKASRLADGKTVVFLDIGDKFLQPDWTISKEIMPDYLHLSPKGYEVWAAAVEPKIVELMGTK
jgi:lysophospholipase L1-like esterase